MNFNRKYYKTYQVQITCARCGKIFMAKEAVHCEDCRKKIASERAKRIGLNRLGNEAYSKQRAARKAGLK